MGENKRNYVAKALPDGTWRIWNKKAKKWWGEVYPRFPEAILNELNGTKETEIIIKENRKLQLERKKAK